MPTVKKQDISVTEEEYLQGELTSNIKHEYVDGKIYAMAGASKNHDIIAGNIYRRFGNHLENINSNCIPYGTDIKVKTATKKYRYTDGMVVCDDSGNDNYTETPIIIIEVLSKSTRHLDRGEKLLEYINIPGLKEYVIIEQDIASIDVHRRTQGWIHRNYILGEEIHFESIGLTLSVEEIYYRVRNEDTLDLSNTKFPKES